MVASLTSQFAQAVQLRAGSDGFHLHLPPVEIEWADVWESLQGLLGGHRWPRKGSPPGIPLTLWAGGRNLELHQLQALSTLLHHHHLSLWRVATTCRATAVAAAQLGYSVEQGSPSIPAQTVIPSPPLYIQNTLRSGVEIRHQGTVVIMGDINPGAEVSAAGDIVVLGRLRGLAHAGCPFQKQDPHSGDPQAVILALNLQPAQLRIADQVARLPEGSPTTPEVAYLQAGEICITPVGEYLSMYRDQKER